MPRTVESIVQCHIDATALRKQNKPIWSKEIALKDLLGDDDSNERSLIVAKEVARRFRAALPGGVFDVRSDDYDDELTSLIEDLECFNPEMAEEISPILNERLDEIYDWADSNRVWIR